MTVSQTCLINSVMHEHLCVFANFYSLGLMIGFVSALSVFVLNKHVIDTPTAFNTVGSQEGLYAILKFIV